MTSLKEGDKAPFFKGINQDGKEITSEDFKGKKLVLYFYPKDNHFRMYGRSLQPERQL